MRDAFSTHVAAVTDNTPAHLDTAGVSAVNFVNWACSVDERMRETDDTYVSRRDVDSDGRLLQGLRYVRDRHMHQVVVSAMPVWRITVTVGPSGRGEGEPEPGISWRPVDDIAEPPGNLSQQRRYQRHRSVYEDALQTRRTYLALAAGLRWLTSEVLAREVELPVWQWPDEPGNPTGVARAALLEFKRACDQGSA